MPPERNETTIAVLEEQIANLQAQLQQQEHFIKAIIDHVPGVIYIRDLDGYFTLVNQSYVDFVQRDYDEIIGKQDYDLFPRYVVDAFRENDRQVLGSGKPLDFPEDVPMEDGIHTFRSIKFPIHNGDGNAIGIGGISIDITAQTRAEQELARHMRLLQALLDNSPMVIYVKDLEGHYVLVNRRSNETLGIDWEKMEGKTDQELFPPEFAALTQQQDKQVLETGQAVEVEDVIEHHGEAHTCLNVKFPLCDENGRISAIAAFVTDITERKRSEEESRQLQAQQQFIETQEAMLRELSTPLIPIADNILIMPLIGTIDNQRAQMVMETLLQGVADQNAHSIILDITGVKVVDAQVADALLQAAAATKLLGANVFLTGVQPQIAQTLIHLGVDLSGITPHSTLQAGIMAAFTANYRSIA